MSGELAYIDSFGGLVACQVMDAELLNETLVLDVKVTGKGNTLYKTGEIVHLSQTRVVPRKAIRRRKYSTKIMPYSWRQILGL